MLEMAFCNISNRDMLLRPSHVLLDVHSCMQVPQVMLLSNAWPRVILVIWAHSGKVDYMDSVGVLSHYHR